jgi:hypothetical protein
MVVIQVSESLMDVPWATASEWGIYKTWQILVNLSDPTPDVVWQKQDWSYFLYVIRQNKIDPIFCMSYGIQTSFGLCT